MPRKLAPCVICVWKKVLLKCIYEHQHHQHHHFDRQKQSVSLKIEIAECETIKWYRNSISSVVYFCILFTNTIYDVFKKKKATIDDGNG